MTGSAAAAAGTDVHWKVQEVQPGATFGVWKNFVIGAWTKPGTAEAVASLARTSRSMKDTYSAVHILKNGAGLPTAEGRAALVDLLKERSGKLACVTVILLGSGFWASAMQSLFTGIHMLVPKGSMKLRVCESIEEATVWLMKEHVPMTNVDVKIDELRYVLAEARAVAMGP